MMPKSLNKYILLCLISLLGNLCLAQTIQLKSDIQLIYSELSKKQPDPFKRTFVYQDDTSLIKKINPFGLVFGGTLYIYQNLLSKHFSADCLYSPSCSEFSKQAIRNYGLLKGVILSVDRVNRCNRMAAEDLKRTEVDPISNRSLDPVSKYTMKSQSNGN